MSRGFFLPDENAEQLKNITLFYPPSPAYPEQESISRRHPMATFSKELLYFSTYFKQAKKGEHILFRWLWLSPEARIERLRELMMPVSEHER